MIWKLEFRGTASPATSGLGIEQTKLSSPADSETGKFVVKYSISDSTVYAEVEISEWPESERYRDIPSISMMVQSAIQGQVNVLNIVHGTHVSVELELFKQDPDDWARVSSDIRCIAERYLEKNARYYELMNLFSEAHDGVWFLQKVNTDLNHAIKYPNETALFCYRAIETMARYFCESSFDNLDSHVWEKFRNTVGVSKEEILLIKKKADVARHGGVAPMPSSSRVEIFDAAWTIYDKYIEFAQRKFDNIEPSLTRDRRAGRL